MTESIQLPRSLGSAQKTLGDLEGLLTSTQWNFAGIIRACTYEDGDADGRLTVAEFAALGIRNLTSPDTILHYRSAWQLAMDQGLVPEARLGRKVPVPELSFPRNPTVGQNIKDPDRRDRLTAQAEADGVGASKVLDVASNPKAVVAALKADPHFAQRVLHANPSIVVEAAKDPEVAAAIAGDRESEVAVMRASGKRGGSGSVPRSEPQEPFARALVLLNLLALKKDAEAMQKVAITDFSGSYVWRGREKDKVLAELDAVAKIVADVRAILTSEVSDDALAEFLKS